MIRSKFLIVSDNISMDAFTQTLSVFNMVENLNAIKVPFALPRLMATSLIERNDLSKDENTKVTLTLKNNDKVIDSKEQEINFKGKLSHKWINAFNNIKVEETGTLTFTLEHNGEEINKRVITVNQVEKK